MDTQKLEAAAVSAFSVQRTGLKIVATADGEALIKNVIEEALKELVADTSNPYDDKLVDLLLPLIDKALAAASGTPA